MKLRRFGKVVAAGDICTDNTTKSLDKHHDLSLLFSQESPFRSIVSTRFTRLIFIGIKDEGKFSFSFCRGAIFIYTASGIELNSTLMRQVFHVCGSSIESIKFTDVCVGMDENAVQKVALKLGLLVLKWCTNVKQLIFGPNESDKPKWITEEIVFNGFASQLQSLF